MTNIEMQDMKFRYPIFSKEREALEKATQQDLDVAKAMGHLIKRFDLDVDVIAELIKILEKEGK